MKQSLYVQYVSYLTAIIVSIVTRINGGKTELTYLHKSMLTKELSTDLKWSSLSVNSTIVAADVVAMDSNLPLKSRDSITSATGEIPKLGMKMKMSEKQMSDIDILVNRKADTKVIVEKIFNDAIKCTVGIYEKLEFMFLQGLSSGVTLIEDENNVGTGIRVDYGYKEENKFGAEVKWSDPNAKPLDDIKRITKVARSKGVSLKFMYMDPDTFDKLAGNTQVKQYFAFSQGFVGSNIPVPDLEQVNSMLKKQYKLQIVVVDRTVITERDGVRTSHKPWADNIVIFLETQKVGKLYYGILAETTRKSKDATYTEADEFILLKKWHEQEPFTEWTSSQALVIPVIEGVDSIYSLDTEEAQDGEQTEGDEYINIYEDSYVLKSNLVAALIAIGLKNISTSMTDAQLIAKVNRLSNKNEAALRKALELPTVDAGDDDTSNTATYKFSGEAEAYGNKTIAEVKWTKVSGPGTQTFDDDTAFDATVSGLQTGEYVFKLTVKDSAGIVASDTVTITATVN